MHMIAKIDGITAASSDPPNPKCLTAIVVFDIWARSPISQQGMVSAQLWGKILHFVFIQLMWNIGVLRIIIWRIYTCDVIELATALECLKQLLMSSISNLGGRQSLEIAVTISSRFSILQFSKCFRASVNYMKWIINEAIYCLHLIDFVWEASTYMINLTVCTFD